jgi:hypothetical protein
MKRILILGVLALGISTPSQAADAAVAANYAKHCASCHGKDGKGQTTMGKKTRLPRTSPMPRWSPRSRTTCPQEPQGRSQGQGRQGDQEIVHRQALGGRDEGPHRPREGLRQEVVPSHPPSGPRRARRRSFPSTPGARTPLPRPSLRPPPSTPAKAPPPMLSFLTENRSCSGTGSAPPAPPSQPPRSSPFSSSSPSIIFARQSNPYVGILAYIVAPSFFFGGTGMMFWGFRVQRRHVAKGTSRPTR